MKLGRMYFKSPFQCCAKMAREGRRARQERLKAAAVQEEFRRLRESVEERAREAKP